VDDLPQSMTEADYRALPDEVARTIEVVHGHVIKCESPAPRHLVILLDEKYEIVEMLEYHLDAAIAEYRLFAIHRSVLVLEQPIRLNLPFAELVSG
jgi:hypothetical protein